MLRRGLCLTWMVCLIGLPLFAKYKVKPLQVRPAGEYQAHQDFQNVIIGAQPFITEEEISRVFDTRKLLEKGIFPVLIVIENNNPFALRLTEKEIFLVGPDGTNYPSIPYWEVLLHIHLKKPLSSYPTKPEQLFRSIRDRDMVADFEHKAFGEKLIAPHDGDHGIVFFPFPEEGSLRGYRLYFPEILNFTHEEALMFFEFPLLPEEP